MRPRRFFLTTLSFSIALAALFAGCGTDSVVDTPDAPPPGAEASPPTDTGVPDTRAPDARPEADARPDATPPQPAPFGLDRRPPNPTCVAPERPSGAASALLTPVFAGAGVTTPMVLAQLPGDNTRFFAAERAGRIVSFAAANPTTKTLVATLPGPVNTAGEGGFLGMAFHPRFAQNGYVFISYTIQGGPTNMQSTIIRMKSTDNGQTFGDPFTIVPPFVQPANNHNGGDVHFGPDGYLYASFGDGGGANDVFGHGQETTGFFSKILRIDVDSASPYAIPVGNPFRGGGGEPATFAYGFRNPYRFAIDPVSGDIWAADVGQARWEEIDRVVAGGNYGWSEREGAHCFPPANTTCRTAGLIDPVFEYPRSEGISIIGGFVYRGTRFPALVGLYIFADYGSGKVWALTPDPMTGNYGAVVLNEAGPFNAWVGFGEDNDRELYVFDSASRIFRIEPDPAAPPPTAFPPRLSRTGCVDPADPKKPVPAMIPYTVNSPLWSDGSEKDRWFSVPDGTTLTVDPTSGDIDFPNGTVLMKTFRVAGKRVETRLFVRHADGEWGGYSYEWDDAQTDATLLPSNKVKNLGAQTWYYPSRSECFTCHSQVAGRALGPEVGQLNGDFVYTQTNRISNQLRTLDHLGYFARPIGDPATLARLPSPAGTTGTVEARARAYLHANCSFCHQPGGTGRGAMDLRYGPSFADTAVCDQDPSVGDLGVPGAKLFAPGQPARSVLSLRMRSTGLERMPPLATRLVDTAGAAVIDSWITQTATCPP